MPKTSEHIRWLRNCCLIGLFLGGLWLPILDNLFVLDTSPVLLEGRAPAGFPAFVPQAEALALYPSKFDQFFRDHFGFRKSLIRAYNAFHVKVLQGSPLPNVILGKNSWLFSTNNNYRARQFTTAQLRQWQLGLEQRRDWLADRGIRYLFVVAPSKETIYPEFMPDSLNGGPRESLLDQLIAHLRAHSTVSILDLRPPMRDAKGTQPLYTRTDTHWNDRGMFVGYQSIVNALSQWFPHLQPLPLSAFEVRMTKGPAAHFDLARLITLQESIAEQYVGLVPRLARRAQMPRLSPRENVTTLADPTLPRAVVLHDSFGHALIPFLSEHFQRAHYYDSRGIHEFQFDIVQQERPDVVIQLIAERHIVPPAFLPTNPPEVEERYLLQHYEQTLDIRLALSAQQQSLLKANMPLSVSPTQDALLLRASHTDPQLILPLFSVSPGTIPTCRIDITSPAPTTLTLFYLTNNTHIYTGILSITRKLRAGRQQVYIPLTDREFSGALRLDPGTVTGEYRIHGIEVRAFSPADNTIAAPIPHPTTGR